MRSRIGPATVMALALCVPGAAAAQTATATLTFETAVTFLLPVNLTQLSPDLEKVRLSCNLLWNSALTKPSLPATWPRAEDFAMVVSGQVITTMKVEFVIGSGWLTDPIGKQADYQCVLEGYSTTLQRWGFFSDTAPEPAFRLKPAPGPINGTFIW